jgi:hypothetical protein
MDELKRLDLSALDPAGEPERWRALVDATLQRVDVVLASRRRDPLTLIASWSRSLIVAAGMMVLLLIPVEIALERREASAEQVRTLVRLSTSAALGEQQPSGEELSRALGRDLLR